MTNHEPVVYLKGPMHPDLFDGETPIMTPVPVSEAGKMFEVEVNYTCSGTETFTVMAIDGDDAKSVASALFHAEYPNDHEIDHMNVRETDEQPTDQDVREFIERREAA